MKQISTHPTFKYLLDLINRITVNKSRSIVFRLSLVTVDIHWLVLSSEKKLLIPFMIFGKSGTLVASYPVSGKINGFKKRGMILQLFEDLLFFVLLCRIAVVFRTAYLKGKDL